MKRWRFHAVGSFFLLGISSLCSAQVIRVRVVDAKNGRPIQKEQIAGISVTLFPEGSKETAEKHNVLIHLDIDADGTSKFTLPEPAPVHLSVGARLRSNYWHCGCAAPAFVVTAQLIQNGIVAGRELISPAISVKAEPREILFVARRFTFFEWLISPLVRD
jgi:hypothetical protein